GRGSSQKGTGQGRPHQPVEAGQECRERLAGAGGRGNEHIAAPADFIPSKLLDLGCVAERVVKPFLDEWMKIHEGSKVQCTRPGREGNLKLDESCTSNPKSEI